MSLYNEIMALDQVEYRHCSDYGRGFMDAIEKSAELAKKYDEEVKKLMHEIIKLNMELINK
jgi:hypothetical protein